MKARISLLLRMAKSLVTSMLVEHNYNYAHMLMVSVFIVNIFKQDDGDIFREEVGAPPALPRRSSPRCSPRWPTSGPPKARRARR